MWKLVKRAIGEKSTGIFLGVPRESLGVGSKAPSEEKENGHDLRELYCVMGNQMVSQENAQQIWGEKVLAAGLRNEVAGSIATAENNRGDVEGRHYTVLKGRKVVRVKFQNRQYL